MKPVEIAAKLCPRAKPSYLKALEQGDALFAKHGITTPLRMAHFLAQCFHETGGLSIEWESGAYSARRLLEIFGEGRHSAAVTPAEAEALAYQPAKIFERVYGLGNKRKAQELGNTQAGDGFKYRGGGILQTTGRGNYRRMGQKCSVDFEAHPEYVLAAEHALKPALIEWTESNLNAQADPHQGYPQGDLRSITRRINGGYNGLDQREAWFKRILPLIDKVELNVTAPPPPDVEPVAPTPPASALPAGKTIAAATVAAGGLTAASQAPDLIWAAIIVGGALAGALLVVLVWRHKPKT